MYLTCKSINCIGQQNGYGNTFEIEESKLQWFRKKGFDIPNTCTHCKAWKDSITRSEYVNCCDCRSNPKEFTVQQIIGTQMRGEKSWQEVQQTYRCRDCHQKFKNLTDSKTQFKCDYNHCRGNGYFEMADNQISFFQNKGLIVLTSCSSCRDWKKSLSDEIVSCCNCRQTFPVSAGRIIAQNKKGDRPWSSIRDSLKCNNCQNQENAVAYQCANSYCQSVRLGGSQQFQLTQREIKFFQDKGMTLPTICKPCREQKKRLVDTPATCVICRRTSILTANTIQRIQSEQGKSWDEIQPSYECHTCKNTGDGWYPRDNSWVIHPMSYKYRWKIKDNLLSDRLYANLHFPDWECDLEHVHEYGIGESVHGYSYSIKPRHNCTKAEAIRLRENGYFAVRRTTSVEGDPVNIGVEGLRRFFESWNANNR